MPKRLLWKSLWKRFSAGTAHIDAIPSVQKNAAWCLQDLSSLPAASSILSQPSSGPVALQFAHAHSTAKTAAKFSLQASLHQRTTRHFAAPHTLQQSQELSAELQERLQQLAERRRAALEGASTTEGGAPRTGGRKRLQQLAERRGTGTLGASSDGEPPLAEGTKERGRDLDADVNAEGASSESRHHNLEGDEAEDADAEFDRLWRGGTLISEGRESPLSIPDELRQRRAMLAERRKHGGEAIISEGRDLSWSVAEEFRQRRAVMAERRKSSGEAGVSGRDAGSLADGAESGEQDAEFDRLWRSRRLPLGVVARTGQEVPLEQQRLLQVGIIGVPNAGKSTLTNLLVGSKISAVSPKTNTTTEPTLGAFTVDSSQVVLYDTPGVVDSRHTKAGSQQKRVRSAWSTASNCDLLLLIIDAHRQIERPDPRVLRLVDEMAAGKQLGQHPPPSILVLNKVDKLGPRGQSMLARLDADFCARYGFDHVFYTSATDGSGMHDLQQHLLSRATLGEWIMEPGWKTDMPPHKRVLEVVREKLFLRLRKELPYEIELQDVAHREMVDGSWRFDQMVFVPTEHVKRIVVGKQGAVIGEVGIKARKELEMLFKKRVHLFLTVKVK